MDKHTKTPWGVLTEQEWDKLNKDGSTQFKAIGNDEGIMAQTYSIDGVYHKANAAAGE